MATVNTDRQRTDDGRPGRVRCLQSFKGLAFLPSFFGYISRFGREKIIITVASRDVVKRSSVRLFVSFTIFRIVVIA